MNTHDTFAALAQELDHHTPPSLDNCTERAVRRLNRRRRLTGLASSVLMVAVAFVLSVNLFPGVAEACSRLPVLKELSRAVAFSPSLSAAVDHQYAQEIRQSQTQNGLTLTLTHMITDPAEAVVFYQLSGPGAAQLEVRPELNGHSNGYGILSGNLPESGLASFTIDFQNAQPPSQLDLSLTVVHSRTSAESASPAPQSGAEDPVAVFRFQLNPDPAHFAQPRVLTPESPFILDGQRLTLRRMEIYPTHVRLSLAQDPENTAWLSTLEAEITDSRGKTSGRIAHGNSGTGSAPDTLREFRFESSFFSRSEPTGLTIVNAGWLDKNRTETRINPALCTAENLPDGASLLSSVREGDHWLLTFRTDGTSQAFSWDYRLSDGRVMQFRNLMSSWLSPTASESQYEVPASPEGIVTLFPLQTHQSAFNPAVHVRLPVTLP